MPSVKNVEEEDKVTVPAENENAKDKAQFFEPRQKFTTSATKKMVISDF